jgi:hypothetical protein
MWVPSRCVEVVAGEVRGVLRYDVQEVGAPRC